MSLYRSHPAVYAWLKDATDDFSHDDPEMLGHWLLHRGVPIAIALAVLTLCIMIFLDFLATFMAQGGVSIDWCARRNLPERRGNDRIKSLFHCDNSYFGQEQRALERAGFQWKSRPWTI